MYKQSFGTNGQIQFANEHEYYKFLGFLARSDGSTSIVWEHNEEQGAWGSEGRIQIYRETLPNGIGTFYLSAGVGKIRSRINCNEFIENLYENHNFVQGDKQVIEDIVSTIPSQFVNDFENGLNL